MTESISGVFFLVSFILSPVVFEVLSGFLRRDKFKRRLRKIENANAADILAAMRAGNI